MSCTCIETVNTKLAERNTRLVEAICLRPFRTSLMIATEVVEKKRGARAVGMFPTFCPFCGVQYEPSETAADGQNALLAAAKEVMELLQEHGPSIVPHLMDSDMNAGQRLRAAIARAEGA